MRQPGFLFLVLAGVLGATVIESPFEGARAATHWEVQEPIIHANLALFPVTAGQVYDSSSYITLDEGLRSGEVEVTELDAGLIRRRPGTRPPGGARVNTLALINHSDKALLLLAGEIVTGGKQDRVIAKDRIVPPEGEPLPLDVFCVEPGRWRGASLAFQSQSLMAAPRVRGKAAVAKSQQEVWDATAAVRTGLAATVGARGQRALRLSSSYTQLESSRAFKERIDRVSADLQREYERALRGVLRDQKIVGVVVAINGEVVWADLFADNALFQRYWSKLLRSYAVEALSGPVVEHAHASVEEADRFLAEQAGKQIIELEPGEYRLVQIDHPRYSIFQLASLWEKSEPMLHFNKLRKEPVRQRQRLPRPVPLRPWEPR